MGPNVKSVNWQKYKEKSTSWKEIIANVQQNEWGFLAEIVKY